MVGAISIYLEVLSRSLQRSIKALSKVCTSSSSPRTKLGAKKEASYGQACIEDNFDLTQDAFWAPESLLPALIFLLLVPLFHSFARHLQSLEFQVFSNGTLRLVTDLLVPFSFSTITLLPFRISFHHYTFLSLLVLYRAHAESSLLREDYFKLDLMRCAFVLSPGETFVFCIPTLLSVVINPSASHLSIEPRSLCGCKC